MAKRSSNARYRGLIIFIAAFLFILIGVLFASYRASNKIDKTTDILDITGEMSDQSYNILTYLQALALQAKQVDSSFNQPDVSKNKALLADLDEAQETFSRLLSVLDKGGDYQYGDDVVNIIAPSSPDAKKSIAATKRIWKKYDKLIQNALSADAASDRSLYLHEAAFFGFNAQSEIYDNLDVIYSNQAEQSNDIAKQSKLIQLVGISLIVVFFGLFMFYFVRQLQKADKQIFQAQEETSNILKTVNEGLFLLDKEQTIGTQNSKELSNIFGRENFEGTTFSNLLANVVSRKDLETAQDFIEQLYNPKVKEKLIQDLNPLDEVQASIVDNKGQLNDRYLKFNFSRVYDDHKNIDSVLVSITDNSRAVELEKRLEHQKISNEQQVEMLASILHSDNHTMEQFLEGTSARLDKINDILRKPDRSQADLVDKIEVIYREIHGLKGEASALGLKKFVQLSHETEEELQKLKSNRSLSGNDFLLLAVNVENLMGALDSVRDVNTMLQSRGATASDSANGNTPTVSKPQIDYFKKAAEEVAERENKHLDFNGYAVQSHLLDQKNGHAIKDIAIQMIRNAIVHGIESPEVRELNHKPTAGEVKMVLMQKDDKHAMLRIYDDGAGLDFEKIRHKLVSNGQYTEETASALSENDLIKEVFKSGLSTANSVSEDAGRGVGLDIVAHRVKELDGRLAVKSQPGKFTIFTITYPI